MRRWGRISAALAFTVGGVMTTGAAASASTAGQADHGCASGWVCIYRGWEEWAASTPEHTYYRYGTYKFYNEFDIHMAFNNQTGGAKAYLCRNSNGTNCDQLLIADGVYSVNLTPYNSIKLTP
ncbi:hypothetical protein [Streptomyces sp. bgisy060]|uniref:hypothetical protein n=1 Tax=Streptomyces sp. bgisy060 TaxID=3413775 RepID=UPI003EC0E66F